LSRTKTCTPYSFSNSTVDVPNSGGASTMGADMRHRSLDLYKAP
jgi:hypothetical protein